MEIKAEETVATEETPEVNPSVEAPELPADEPTAPDEPLAPEEPKEGEPGWVGKHTVGGE